MREKVTLLDAIQIQEQQTVCNNFFQKLKLYNNETIHSVVKKLNFVL